MTEVLDGILARFGQAVTVTRGEETAEGRAFLQAIQEEGKAAPYAASPLGFADDRRWRCITRLSLSDGDGLRFGERAFRVRSAWAVYLGGELCHYEAMLTAEWEAAE